jgi:SAM-dependent methyltransferase
MEDLKGEFARHLASIGFEFDTPRNVVLEKLRKRMGEQRFKEFQSRHSYSTSSQEEFYSQFQDIIEGNLMRSMDTCATLDASFSLYQQCVSRLESGMRLIELGCWTGGLASFIAGRHPGCSVVGVDLSHEVIKACCDFYRLPNLGFQHWNYRWGKSEDLAPADVLLCSMGVVHHLPVNSSLPDPRAVRRSREYTTQRDHAIGYFGQWRSAAKDGGSLYAVLRIGLFSRFLAWIDAAQETGWTPRLDRLWHVDMSGEKSPLPGLLFEARRCEAFAEETIMDRWAWFSRRNHLYGRLEGAAALAAFRALGDKRVLATRDYRDQAVLTRDEVGLAGGSGYVFTHDAAFKFRLLVISCKRAEDLAAGVAVKGSSTPIDDDGAFQIAASAIQPKKGSVFSTGVSNGVISGGSFFSAACQTSITEDGSAHANGGHELKSRAR